MAPSDEAFPPKDPNSTGPQSEERSPVAVALEWVSRITTVALMMVLPGLAGVWLDKKLGTGFLALLGFALGLVAGIWQLVVISRPTTGPGARKRRRSSTHGRSSPPDNKDASS